MARLERLNKYLAECGVASRRGADQIIADGRVKINGKVVTELGTKVNIYNDTIMVDDNSIDFFDKKQVFIVKKFNFSNNFAFLYVFR